MKIKWLGQSGYLLKTRNTTLCIDPYLSDVVEEITGKKRLVPPPVMPGDICADAIICTHNHLDHLDTKAVPGLSPAVFYAPSDCLGVLNELGVKASVAFDEGACFKVGDFSVKAVYAEHTVPAVGVVVTCEGKSLYFSGDTYYSAKLREIGKTGLDYAFICINGKLGNMNVDEAVSLARELSPKIAIPNHYGMFAENTVDPKLFTKEIKNSFEMVVGKEYEVRECLI